MTMKKIREKYGVPAKRGMIVKVGSLKGKIVGSDGLYLRIKIIDPVLEIHKHVKICHPTWHITYLNDSKNTQRLKNERLFLQ